MPGLIYSYPDVYSVPQQGLRPLTSLSQNVGFLIMEEVGGGSDML